MSTIASQSKPTFLPASLFMPSRPTAIHETSHSPQTSLSLPSLIQPHLAAATASIAAGLLAHVDNLNVASRVRKDGVDEGRYSVDELNAEGGAVRVDVLNGNAWRVREAVREAVRARIFARFGVDFVRSESTLGEIGRREYEAGSQNGERQKTAEYN